MYHFSPLFLLATAAKSLRPSEDVQEESAADPSVADSRNEAAAAPTPTPAPEPQRAVNKAAPPPPPPPTRTSAEQRRREALEESLTDYVPISNMRAVERMNDKELKASKNLLMCFLSGRAPPDEDELPAAGRSDEQKSAKLPSASEDRSSKYVADFQHDMTNLSAAYHYKYDPTLPLPTSLIDRVRPPQEKKHKRVKKSKGEKKKKQKTMASEDEGVVLTKIAENPLDSSLLWTTKRTESIDTEGEDCVSELAPRTNSVPTVVDVNLNTSTENQECALDESVHSASAVADEASALTANPGSYLFEWDVCKYGWECKRCCIVHPSFQSAHAFIAGSSDPIPRLMNSHKQACLGLKADLSKALDVMLKLTKTSKITFKHISSAEFGAVVRIVANEDEEFVKLFTADLRNRWLDPVKHKVPSANINWMQHPVEASEEYREKLIAALVAFAKKMGLGYAFVANEYFVELFRMISPNCCLPSPNDLIANW